jgi:hypothetical protein
MTTAVDINKMSMEHRLKETKNMPIARPINEFGTRDEHWQSALDELMRDLLGTSFAAFVWIAGCRRRIFAGGCSRDGTQHAWAADM